MKSVNHKDWRIIMIDKIVNVLKDTDECKSCEYRESTPLAIWNIEYCSNLEECDLDKEELEFYD